MEPSGHEHPRPKRFTEGACPFCGQQGTVLGWRPVTPWLTIEGCACSGFFLWAGLATSRLTQLSSRARQELSKLIVGMRSIGFEAWCTTNDGTAIGPLVVHNERPDRPRLVE